MIELRGKYNSAKIFTNNIEETAISDIINLCNQEFIEGSKIRIMSDVHAGKGCVIGTTLTLSGKVVPNLVGVDIGCGMNTTNLRNITINLHELDKFIRNSIPSGYNINESSKYNYKEEIKSLRCFRDLKRVQEFNKALGTLGGGNHFIEVDIDEEENKYLIIHSGSRNLGKQVAEFYQNKAYEYHSGLSIEYEEEKKRLIHEYKLSGRKAELQEVIKGLSIKYKKETKLQKELCYLEGQLFNDYLHDMKIVQMYANINREVMAKTIVEDFLKLRYSDLESFKTIHNYIDMEDMILRKGSISAKKGEMVLIPINMRDGCILAVGKGNPDWNYSAPHGAGRILSRGRAKENIKIEDFIETMKDIYTTSVNSSTLDEAPMAYKPIQEIVDNIVDTVEILKIIKPIYNFKA